MDFRKIKPMDPESEFMVSSAGVMERTMEGMRKDYKILVRRKEIRRYIMQHHGYS